jgi:hypothetical protein
MLTLFDIVQIGALMDSGLKNLTFIPVQLFYLLRVLKQPCWGHEDYSTIIQDVPCGWVEISHCSGGMYCLHLQGRRVRHVGKVRVDVGTLSGVMVPQAS